MSISPAVSSNAAIAHPRASTVSFALINARILQELSGPTDQYISYIERRLDVRIGIRGTDINIEGNLAEDAQEVMRDLYRTLELGDEEMSVSLIDAKITQIVREDVIEEQLSNVVPHASIPTRNKKIVARNQAQTRYISAMQREGEDLIFGLGPAGTGKTYLAVAQAVSALIQGNVKRLIFSRPAVEAGEKLGFLPGDMKEKVDPYLRPIYDALYDCLPVEQVERRLASGEIEIAPLAFMRGRTLADAFIILDEAQNATKEQMKMFLTRFGENSKMVICGDPTQTDLPGGARVSGLSDAMDKLEGIEGIHFTHFTAKDIVRHPVVGRIVEAYEAEAA